MHYCYRDDETHAARWYEPRKEYLYLKDEERKIVSKKLCSAEAQHDYKKQQRHPSTSKFGVNCRLLNYHYYY